MSPVRNLHKALDLIEERLTKPLLVEELARRAGMSFWYFQRTFSAMVGESAAAYLRQRRLTEAARCIMESESRLLDIALEFQFESHEAFTRAFKAQFGLTPSAWRRDREKHGRLRQLSKSGTPPLNLTKELLKARFRHMNQKPEIVTLPARSFMGLRANFIGAVSPKTNNLAVIPKLWQRFFERIHEIPTMQPEVSYGLCNCVEGLGEKPSNPDECVYLTARLVESGARPLPGMVVWETPASTYARFTHKGGVEKIGATMSYIYGKWLPESDYERAEGAEVELYDQRFKLNSEASEFDVYIPIALRTR